MRLGALTDCGDYENAKLILTDLVPVGEKQAEFSLEEAVSERDIPDLETLKKRTSKRFEMADNAFGNITRKTHDGLDGLGL